VPQSPVSPQIHWLALTICALFLVFIAVLGFASAHWRRGDLRRLREWGLGGNRFGTILTWFLVGGDVFTAYTFIAVPALAYGQGAIAFYAVPYTILIYPILFLVFPRLWQICHKHDYMTAGDFVCGHLGNRYLALAVSVTGIVATLPYIALQLVGIQVVVGALGIPADGWAADLPLLIAFAILAAFTYSSGLRAPASISIVKDILVYVTAFAAIIWIPIWLHGFTKIFAAVPSDKLLLPRTIGAYGDYSTLVLASALALFLYPHALTGLLSASSAKAIRRNAALLPGYSLVLGLLALVGVFAIAAHLDDKPQYAHGLQLNKNFAVPALLLDAFPEWFAGVAFAGIAIGALVPAAIMAIGAANLFARNIYREFINPQVDHAQEAQLAKWFSLIVKAGALAFVLSALTQYAVQLQLLSVVWIIQTLPAVMVGVYTRWFNSWALLFGWLAGMVLGTLMFLTELPTSPERLELSGYPAVCALIVNLLVATGLTLTLNAAGPRGPSNVDHAAASHDRDAGARADASIDM
jgi:SSS family solute:Na+ symporter